MSDVWLALLALYVVIVVVNEPLQVEEGSDAVYVGADGPEVPVPGSTGLGTEVAQEELAKHLLAVHTGAQTPGPPPGPGAGGGDQQGSPSPGRSPPRRLRGRRGRPFHSVCPLQCSCIKCSELRPYNFWKISKSVVVPQRLSCSD